MYIGRMITSVTSRFGVISRKASMRLATETGKKLVDRSQQLGRSLKAEEIQEVFAETLPKRCRPQILGTKQEVISLMERNGASKEAATEFANSPYVGAACLSNGVKKSPIYIPQSLEQAQQGLSNSLIAHELEHALERNNRIKGIFGRKFFMPLFKKKLQSPKTQELIEFVQNGSIKYQVPEMQLKNNLAIRRTDKIEVINQPATRAGVIENSGLSEQRYTSRLRSLLRRYVNGKHEQSENLRIMNSFKNVLDAEIPAYSVQGEVLKYAQNISNSQMVSPTGVSIMYKDAKKLINQERLLYLKNKLLGRLKSTPAVYQSEKDIYKLVSNPEDKKLLEQMLKQMRLPQKQELFEIMKKDKTSINRISKFINETSISRTSPYLDELYVISAIKPEVLENPNFIKIANMVENGRPLYDSWELRKISELSSENVEKLTQMLGEKTQSGLFKYANLARDIEHPQLETLKKITEIEVNGKLPYRFATSEIGKLPPKDIDEILIKAQEAQKDGLDVERLIAQKLRESETRNGNFGLVKASRTTNVKF